MGSVYERDPRSLTIDNLNPDLTQVQFGLKVSIRRRAQSLEQEIKSGQKKPFPKVVNAAVGDCHAVGQRPITFVRQVLALCSYPDLLQTADFPADAKQRARKILSACENGSIGSYTDSRGLEEVRQDVARYITERDGHPSDPGDIFLSAGATEAVRGILTLLLTGKGSEERAGFMIPVPEYPLYSASVAEFGASVVPYYLEEGQNWSLDICELERAIAEAKTKCIPRALVVINPGNPASSVLTKDVIEKVIKFAYRHNLFLMADEVYQHNIWTDGVQFVSFKKTLMEMGPPFSQMQLASFMSTSKGYLGECSMRGGYVEVINLPEDVKSQYRKVNCVRLNPPVTGQVVLDCLVDPPRPGDPSFERFMQEKNGVLNDLKAKAHMLTGLFNSMEGISCAEVSGSMYAFPRLHLPERAVQAAGAAGMTPDVWYCMSLLEETGISTLPGSTFGQQPGTCHFRMSILPQIEDLVPALERFRDFHLKFIAKYK